MEGALSRSVFSKEPCGGSSFAETGWQMQPLRCMHVLQRRDMHAQQHSLQVAKPNATAPGYFPLMFSRAQLSIYILKTAFCVSPLT